MDKKKQRNFYFTSALASSHIPFDGVHVRTFPRVFFYRVDTKLDTTLVSLLSLPRKVATVAQAILKIPPYPCLFSKSYSAYVVMVCLGVIGCKHGYSGKDYFLSLMVLITITVALRMLYYTIKHLLGRGEAARSQSQESSSSDNDEIEMQPENTRQMHSNSNSNSHQRLHGEIKFVILAGDVQPTSLALPTPFQQKPTSLAFLLSVPQSGLDVSQRHPASVVT